jgi:hypothetical protein
VPGTAARSLTSQTSGRRWAGLGAGDLKDDSGREHGATIEMPDVIFVDRKVLAIEKLVSMKPERTS